MADNFEHERPTSETSIASQTSISPIGARKRFLSLLLGAFYTVAILAIAVSLGSFLYEAARTYSFANHPLPDLNRLDEGMVDNPLDAGTTQAEETATQIATDQQMLEDRALHLPQERINILLLGTDERPDENGPARTDTMMLVTLDLAQQTAGMISLPRDLWVPIPGYDITTKINTAYDIGERRGYPGGGSQLAKDTVSSFIGRPVEYYVRVNFNGFVRFIDLIDGVDIHIPKTIHDEQYPTPDYGYEIFHLDAGHQHLDGEVALKYVRTRHGDSDYLRAGRQQQVIQAVLDKVLAADMIPKLIAEAPKLVSTMRDSFSTDIPLSVAIDLATYMRQNNLTEPRNLVLDNRFGQEGYSDGGAWILMPDRSLVREALSQFFDAPPDGVTGNGSTGNVVSGLANQTANPAPQNPSLVDDPADVRLEVLNGTGYPGVAAQIRDTLQASGWQVVSIGDADRSDYRRTLIVNYNANESLVQRINADLRLPADLPTLNGLILSDIVDMRIIVGQDFLKDVLDIGAP